MDKGEYMSLKISYVNTWGGFDKESMFFSRILKEVDSECKFDVGYNSNDYDLVISLMPNVLNGHHQIDLKNITNKKLCFTGESYPIFDSTPHCDGYIGFDYEEDAPQNVKYMRMPLYAIYNLDHMHRYGCSSYEELRNKFYTKQVNKKYSAVISNPKNEFRNSVLKFLVNRNLCDSGGNLYSNIGNVGSEQTDKMNFVKNYMFGMAFENISKRGYITEKIYEVFMAGSVPYYWGAPDIELEFNPKSYFIFDASTSEKMNESIQQMVNRLNDEESFENARKEDPMTGFKSEKYIKNCKEMLKLFVMNLVESK